MIKGKIWLQVVVYFLQGRSIIFGDKWCTSSYFWCIERIVLVKLLKKRSNLELVKIMEPWNVVNYISVYCSFKVFVYFWLAKISQIILHDQLPLTSLGRHNANISTVSHIVLIIKEKGQQEHSSSTALVEIQS